MTFEEGVQEPLVPGRRAVEQGAPLRHEQLVVHVPVRPAGCRHLARCQVPGQVPREGSLEAGTVVGGLASRTGAEYRPNSSVRRLPAYSMGSVPCHGRWK